MDASSCLEHGLECVVTTDLQTALSRIEAKLRRVIEAGEKFYADGFQWQNPQGDFIAIACTITPATARALLVGIDALMNIVNSTPNSPSKDQAWLLDFVTAKLQGIADEFEEKA